MLTFCMLFAPWATVMILSFVIPIFPPIRLPGKPRLAIAAYHLEDDQIKIPEIVAATRPDYEMECGPCGFARGWIVPSTLLFH